jgi:hypothetical protein
MSIIRQRWTTRASSVPQWLWANCSISKIRSQSLHSRTCDDSQVFENKAALGWLVDCFYQGMLHRPLFSADDKSRSGFERQLSSPASHRVGLSASTEARELLRRFNPRLIGFGIADPSSSHPFDSSELTDTRSRNVASQETQEAK